MSVVFPLTNNSLDAFWILTLWQYIVISYLYVSLEKFEILWSIAIHYTFGKVSTSNFLSYFVYGFLDYCIPFIPSFLDNKVEILPKPLCNTIKMIYTYFVLKWHMTELSSMCLHSNLNNRQPLLRFKWPDPYCFLQN